MRRPHILARNHGGEYPRDVIVMDTETNTETMPDGAIGHRLAFGWAMFARRQQGERWSAPRWHRFETREEFWSWALKRCRVGARLVIYCHNAEFDAQVVDAFGELERRRWRLVNACLQGPPTIIRWRRGKRSVCWLDSLNYWPLSLEELGKRFGLPKLPMPSSWADREASDAYCRRDVEVVWASLRAFWRFLAQHDLGTAAATMAGQAFNAYRHRFMRHEILVDCNEAALELARESYFGGRVECFTLGKVSGGGQQLDVNSMYPAVMHTLEAPTRLLTVRGRVELAQLEAYLERYCCVADVELRSDVPAYPARRDGKLVFPVGDWRVVLTSPELRHALAHGAVVRCHRVAVYERAPIFREWCEWLWATRRAAQQRGDQVEDWQLKRLGNALYGKFGQRGRVWLVVGTEATRAVRSFDSYDVDAHEWRHYRQIGASVQVLEEAGESANSHPAIAAHVTAAARMVLWAYLERAGLENVHYVDTDSLMVGAAGAHRLAADVDPGRLGGLKLEGAFVGAEIRGLKDYTLDGVSKTKGISRRALWVGPNYAVQDQWVGWAGALRRGRVDMPVTVPTIKVLARTYSKGVLGPGGRVAPLRLTLPAGPLLG